MIRVLNTRLSRTASVCTADTRIQSRPFAMREAPLLSRPRTDAADVNAICLSLTARQRDVLGLMMQGKSNKAICRVLNLAEQTVKNHVSAILRSLKVTNRTEAVIKVSGTAVALLSFASTICGYQAVGQN